MFRLECASCDGGPLRKSARRHRRTSRLKQDRRQRPPACARYRSHRTPRRSIPLARRCRQQCHRMATRRSAWCWPWRLRSIARRILKFAKRRWTGATACVLASRGRLSNIKPRSTAMPTTAREYPSRGTRAFRDVHGAGRVPRLAYSLAVVGSRISNRVRLPRLPRLGSTQAVAPDALVMS